MPLRSEDMPGPDHVEQMTAAPGETRDVIPPFPTFDNVEFTEEELANIGRAFVAMCRETRKF